MKQTIEIEVPDGKKAVWKDNKVVFEDMMPNLPKTWIEYFKLHFPKEILPKTDYIWACTTTYFDCPPKYDSLLHTKNLLTSDTAAKQHLALMQLHQLRDCYRQGWQPDWNDDTCKYCIFYNSGYWIESYTKIRYFLSFQSRQIAEEFLNNFRELIEEAGDLI